MTSFLETLCLCVLLCASSVAAQTVTEREVLPNGKGPQRLPVDASLIAASADGSLSDLRLKDANGNEIPYLLMPPDSDSQSSKNAPLMSPVKFMRRPSEPGFSRFHLGLEGRHLPIRAFVLDVAGDRLMRDARILQAVLDEGEPAPVVLGSATLQKRKEGDVSVADTRIPVLLPTEPELELCVDDGDNPPIALVSVAAELSFLPWIYFESPDGAALTASVGNRDLNPPRYDLEAVRNQIGNSKLASAHFGTSRTKVLPLKTQTGPFDPGPGGSVKSAEFAYQREVPTIAPGPAALVLDAEVLSFSPTLNDLRIVDSKERQIQYILERREEPLTVDLVVPKPETKGKVTSYLFSIPFPKLPSLRLVLTTSLRVFERTVTIEEAEPSKTPSSMSKSNMDRSPTPLHIQAIWRGSDPNTEAAPLVIDLGDTEGDVLAIRVDEGDNSVLPIRAAMLLLPKYRLRFFHPGSKLTLLYGNKNASRPRYDIALLAPRLRGFGAIELAPAPRASSPTPIEPPSFNMKAVFWIVLLLSVIVLLVLLGRLLKQSGPPTCDK